MSPVAIQEIREAAEAIERRSLMVKAAIAKHRQKLRQLREKSLDLRAEARDLLAKVRGLRMLGKWR